MAPSPWRPGAVLLSGWRSEGSYWSSLREALAAASPAGGPACGAAELGSDKAVAVAGAFVRAEALVGDYRDNRSSSFLNSGRFLDTCEDFPSHGWAVNAMPCVLGFVSAVACVATVQDGFGRYAQAAKDIIGTAVLDSLGPWEGKPVLDWLLSGSVGHLWQWLSELEEGWSGWGFLEASGWPATSGAAGRRNSRPGPVMASLLARLTRFQVEWERERGQKGSLAEETWRPTLEALMYAHHTDKSRDDHKYSDLYAMLLDPIRDGVRNVTELGVMSGQSLKVWHEYFARATIYGLDHYAYYPLPSVRAELEPFPRVRLLRADSQRESSVAQLNLLPGSMDLIVDDASHVLAHQERSLHVMWRFVRPGGYYVIEDVEWDREGDRRTYPVVHAPERLKPRTREILRGSDAFFADATVGHRAFDLWSQRVAAWSPPGHAPQGLARSDRESHQSHLLVIRKRVEPLPPVAVQTNVWAMVM